MGPLALPPGERVQLREIADAQVACMRGRGYDARVTVTLDQVAEAHRAAAGRAGVDLRHTPGADLVLMLDPLRLRQLVGNLVTNAIRHTPAGGSMTIGAAVTGDELTVTVADTGAGIAAGDLPRVFDRFWRADTSRSRGTGGSGLGLAIARKLAEAHGGDITVRSRLDEGSTFTVTLRAVRP